MLPIALGVTPEVVAAAIQTTQHQQAEHAQALAAHETNQARLNFRPHILVNVDINQRRAPLVAAICFGGPSTRCLKVPADLPLHAEKVQLALVRSLIDSYAASPNGERCRFLFGGPVSFTYCPTFNEAWVFSTDGNLLRKTTGSTTQAQGVARIGGKAIPDNFFSPVSPD